MFIAIAIAFISISIILERKRAAAIQQLADTLGFAYQENPLAYLPDSIWSFALFNKGRQRTRRIKNLIQGTQNGATVSIGDYQYTSGSGKNKHTYRQTVVFIESDQLHLPSFLLTPENLFHKVGNLFGYHDIDFDTYPEFSNRYLLRGSDEDSIRHQFHDGILSFYQRQQGIYTEGLGNLLLYYQQQRRLAPKDWHTLLSQAMEAYEQFSQQGY